MKIEPIVIQRLSLHALVATLLVSGGRLAAAEPGLSVADSSLRCDYRVNPLGLDTLRPRFHWIVVSDQRGESQTAYQIRVASSARLLATDLPDLWDSGKVMSPETLQIQYDGKPLSSRQKCYWKVRCWDRNGIASDWSETAFWTMGLLEPSDWKAEYISYEDSSSISKDTSKLYLPAARQYRKAFFSEKEVARATVYSTALGIYELEINGARVGDAYFAPGWTDYRQRAYYNTYEVTDLVKRGENVIGARVADGWYSGYVGFGLLTGMGTERQGRWNYGKTPSLMTQMEVEYVDGTRATISTDATWTVTADGPIQEADLLMGESYDARKEMPGWSSPGFDDANWDNAVLARDIENIVADFYEAQNPKNVGGGPRIQGTPRDLGFKRPRLESFPGVPVRITEELPAKKITEREPGTYVFDLGQNFAGVIRLNIKGPAGHRVQIRYAEMLHPDGRMMTENLRKARATDYYVCKGDPDGEIYQPRFTFHGFQFVEVANFPGEVDLDTVTGLVMHSDTPMTSEFECSDPMVNQLFKNVVWTQRANFLDLPTDCPQRDERMGWTGDAQAYVGTAAYNADIGAFYTKWLRELMESQRESGAFPGYSPFPFQHGWDFGSAWADAGVICPWTIWQAYGDTRVIEDCWEPMTRFMQWRQETSNNDLGIVHGNAWGDWLAQGASTPLDYVDTVYFAISARMMSEMAEAIGHDNEAKAYRNQLQRTKKAFQAKYLRDDGSINVNTQTAQALALFADLVPEKQCEATGRHLAKMIAENGNHMSTGFLGTRPLLPVLSSAGQHDLATFLLQSREFPSWGYEIENGATTIWERWDSYTKEDAFGRHNAAMNSFSHYAFGAVCEWMFDTLAGIKSEGPGYSKIIIHPHVPTPNSNAMVDVIDWVRASYDSVRGTIRSDWKVADAQFHLHVSIPANTTATVVLPTEDPQSILESGKSAMDNVNVSKPRIESGSTKFVVGSGDYEFTMPFAKQSARKGLVTSKPKDTSINPGGIDMTNAKELVRWDFANPSDVEKWTHVSNVKVEQRDGKAFLVATGNDSQMSTRLAETVSGSLVVQLRAMPSQGATSQFFWALPERGFNGTQQNIRPLTASDQVNDYLFSVNETKPIQSIRFDPFNTYDEHANVGEMMIESIAIYQLGDKHDSEP